MPRFFYLLPVFALALLGCRPQAASPSENLPEKQAGVTQGALTVIQTPSGHEPYFEFYVNWLGDFTVTVGQVITAPEGEDRYLHRFGFNTSLHSHYVVP